MAVQPFHANRTDLMSFEWTRLKIFSQSSVGIVGSCFFAIELIASAANVFDPVDTRLPCAREEYVFVRAYCQNIAPCLA
jgi:hypothetical protein